MKMPHIAGGHKPQGTGAGAGAGAPSGAPHIATCEGHLAAQAGQ